jgi:saccharopine dehydrogenase-like NADP-dependent oxidoreductase
LSDFSYVVFGAGRQGTAAIHDLALNCEARRVVVVEPDDAHREAAAARLEKLLKRCATELEFVPALRAGDLADHDVVLSCAPFHANVALTQMALEAGVAFCDLGGNPDTVAVQEQIAARQATAVVPDCGVSPGLSNILAVHCARAHGADTIRVRCGGLPLERPDAYANPLQYKLVFSAWGLISEYSGSVPVIREGKVTRWGALGSIEEFDEQHECSPTSNNSPQVVHYLAKCGVREYDYMTVRYKGHWPLVRGWKTLGYLHGDKARDAELAQRLERDPVLRYDPKRDRDKLILRVQASKTVHSLRHGFEYRLDVHADARTQFTAMELSTCWGITIVAHHMASGRGKPKGFATPERFVDTSWVLGELEKRLATLKED